MFGSTTPFGQSASTPFGSQSPFGQNNAFGQSSSPSTPAFGAASSQGFGTSTPAFGSQSSTFGGSSAFGQNSNGFGSGTQTSPFGSSVQQSQPAFGSNMFGSTPSFGAPSQPSFGGTSTPATGFGATNTPAFGSTPTPTFGSTGSAFGVGSTSAFSAGSTPNFGAAPTSAFGVTSTPPFGAASASAFGQSSSQAFGSSGGVPSFGGSTTPSFSLNSTPAFGQSTPSFGGSTFGSGQSPFGVQSSSGVQATTSTFGSGTFGQSNLGGSRVTPYLATADTDGTSTPSQGKLESISAMQAYKDKSHEELRWEDYQRGDKGGPNSAGQSTPVLNSGVPGAVPNPFGSSPTLGQSTTNLFSMSTPSTQTNVFAPKPTFGSTGVGTTTPTFGSSPFGSTSATTPSLFGSSSAQTPSPFGASTSAFTSSPSIFGTASSSATGSSSIFGPTQSQGQSPFGVSGLGSQPSPLFQSSSPSLGIGSSSGQTNSLFGSSSSFSNAFNTTSNSFPASGFSTSSFSTGGQLGFGQSTPSLATPFQPSLPSQPNNLFNFSNAGQAQAGGSLSIFGQSIGQSSSGIQSSAVLQPVAITNPFGTLPAMPHMSIGNAATSPSIQYGISSMPVVDKPAPVRVASLLTSRHLSQRRIRLPTRKYHPKNDDSRVAFFSEEDEAPSTPKADALFIPRENPRALFIRPIDQWAKPSMKEASVLAHENGTSTLKNQRHSNGSIAEVNGIANGNDSIKNLSNSAKISVKSNGSTSSDGPNQKVEIEATLPKLRHSDYYTEPETQELAAKERAEPGYCRHVKDFVVGRHGYGSIKFLGETDVRGLDLESVIQFNDREVIVYMDDSKKPPVGQGLNKPAVVTLLNIKCIDKKTGNQILEGPRLEKYKQMLKKKAEDQGAEFLSYDPAEQEWKFKVSHFSKYVLCDDGQWDTELLTSASDIC